MRYPKVPTMPLTPVTVQQTVQSPQVVQSQKVSSDSVIQRLEDIKRSVRALEAAAEVVIIYGPNSGDTVSSPDKSGDK